MERVAAGLEVVIDRSSPVPLYHQLAGELRRAITEGRLVRGGYLDNEVELAERLQMSRPTVRRAIQELVDAGLLVRQRGVGTQVVNDDVRPKVRLASLHDTLTAEGRSPQTTVITCERVVADVEVSRKLHLPDGAVVVHLERCRFADGRRLAILRNWLIVDAAGALTPAELTSSGLYALLRARGVWPHFVVREVGARSASQPDAALLGLPVGAPLLTVSSVMQDRSGRRIDVADHLYDASAHTLELAVVES